MRIRRLAFPILTLALLALSTGSARAEGAPEPPPQTPEIAPEPEIFAPRAETFLADVELLISEPERAAYLALQRSYQRLAFVKKFWEVRDPYPQTARNELAERWMERLTLARERYGDLTDDRAKMLLWNGEPGRLVRLRCPEHLRIGEAWVYKQTDAIPASFVLVMLSSGVSEKAPHRLWSARQGYREALAWQGAAASGAGMGGERDVGGIAEQIARDCPRGDELLELLSSASDWPELAERFRVIPKPNPEWVHSFQSYSTDLPEGAPTLPATVEVRFSGRNQSRTIVDAAVVVSASELPEPSAPGAGALVLDGEVLRNDELFDHFRYRFDAPRGRDAGDSIPFAARRFLRPGSYTLVLRLQDPASGRYFRSEQALEVPAPSDVVPSPVPAVAQATAPEVGATGATAGGSTTAAAPPGSTAPEPILRLRAPTDRLISGRMRVEAETRGFTPARVEFTLDGQLLLSKRRAPFSVDLDLGRIPRLRRISASAYDTVGAVVAEDEIVINGGPHRFAVRILEPERAPAPGTVIEARARVDLPEGEALDRLEFYVDDERLATLYQPPFAVALQTPRGKRVSYLRAVAYLKDGIAAEDVRLLSGEENSIAVDVDFVELYTTALDRRGRPVEDLAESEVTVLEDDEAQEIRRFERVDTAPIHAGVMIDISSSMLEELYDARVAAERFFREILTEKDRAAVITFADAPRLAVRFTGDLEVLAGGLADLKAEGETRFYDAVAFALHYFSGVRGKRAIIILSDFADSGSRYRMDEIVEYARRTGVALYGIGLNVPRQIPEAGLMLDRLARETGGRAYRISRVTELGTVYESIRSELRSQYLIAYQSSKGGGSQAFREVEVEVKRPGVEARTIRGYYP